MEIYVDLLFLLNFCVDLLLIVGTNRLAGHSAGVKRALPSAALGAVYAIACVLPGFSFLGNTFWRLVCLALMSAIAFGVSQSGFRRSVLFVLMSMALGGIALGLNRGGFLSIVLAAGMVCLMCLLGFRGRAGQQHYVPVTISHGGRSVALTALIDTGNTLRDPISASPVLVVDGSVAEKLLSLPAGALYDPIKTLSCGLYTGLRLIPYSAVGQPVGLLLGLRVDRVELNGKQAEYVVAFAPQRLGHGQYQALVGGAL